MVGERLHTALPQKHKLNFLLRTGRHRLRFTPLPAKNGFLVCRARALPGLAGHRQGHRAGPHTKYLNTQAGLIVSDSVYRTFTRKPKTIRRNCTCIARNTYTGSTEQSDQNRLSAKAQFYMLMLSGHKTET